MHIEVDDYSADDKKSSDEHPKHDKHLPFLAEHLLLSIFGSFLELFGVIYISQVLLFIKTALSLRSFKLS